MPASKEICCFGDLLEKNAHTRSIKLNTPIPTGPKMPKIGQFGAKSGCGQLWLLRLTTVAMATKVSLTDVLGCQWIPVTNGCYGYGMVAMVTDTQAFANIPMKTQKVQV